MTRWDVSKTLREIVVRLDDVEEALSRCVPLVPPESRA